MRPAVERVWMTFSERFEGRLPFMYLDRKGLVTTGVGNLIDSPAAALTLPWARPDGLPASRVDIENAWHKVKGRQDWRDRGGRAFGPLTTIRLSDAAIDGLVFRKLAENERAARERFPGYDTWPADAQLAILSMAWAAGAHVFARFPKMCRALHGGDFEVAAAECELSGVGVEPRNEANRILLLNAFRFAGTDEAEAVHYPGEG